MQPKDIEMYIGGRGELLLISVTLLILMSIAAVPSQRYSYSHAEFALCDKLMYLGGLAGQAVQLLLGLVAYAILFCSFLLRFKT